MNRLLCLLLLAFSACAPLPNAPTPTHLAPTETLAPLPTSTLTPSPTVTPSPAPEPLVPNFEHIVVIVFENTEFEEAIESDAMPTFKRLASDYTLLTQFYAIRHPSLPNYLAMIGGDTFDVDRNCEDCFIDASILPDLIEQSGRTWKTYQEDMPRPCFFGTYGAYAQNHNPFTYFDSIRLDAARCEQTVRPFTDLSADLAAGALPNFVFITPNICNIGHDCWIGVSDEWLGAQMKLLMDYFSAHSQSFLIVLTWDEGDSNASCCGLPESAGGRIATVLISPQVQNGFEDDTPYTLYSLLKTIAEAWGLPYLGHAADENTALIVKPWR